MAENPAEMGVKPPTKAKKRKGLYYTKNQYMSERARVNIGVAFKRWRALKSENGLRSDEAVALCLLDGAKSLPSVPSSSASSDKRMKVSKSEVQILIQQEVKSALKQNEIKLQSLIETVQQLDSEVDYENCLQRLEARINIISKRAEAAFAFMSKEKSPVSRPSISDIFGSDSEEEDMDNSSHDENSTACNHTRTELLQTMKKMTKVALRKMHADKEALTAAAADLSREQPPSVFTPHSSPEVERVTQKESEQSPDEQENSEAVREPELENVKQEHAETNSLEHKDEEQDNSAYPPLPSISFPSTLAVEAASYHIPQKVLVHLAFIRKPAGLSVLWGVADKDPSAPPMDSYSVYISMEKGKGSNVFSNWTVLGEVKAAPLPMCVLINKYKPGLKVRVAVVGKDVFGRYGPYSEVVTAEKSD